MALISMSCFRHSVAMPIWTTMSHEEDLVRPLTRESIDVAARRREALGVARYDVVCTSRALRATMTAQALMGTIDPSVMRDIPELCYDGPDTPRGKWLAEQYKELGFKPYRAYYKRDTESYLAKQAGAALRQCRQAAEDANARHALVVTHMPILPCLGLSTTVGVSRQWDSTFVDYAFKEGEGFTLTMDGPVASNVEFHIN